MKENIIYNNGDTTNVQFFNRETQDIVIKLLTNESQPHKSSSMHTKINTSYSLRVNNFYSELVEQSTSTDSLVDRCKSVLRTISHC